MSQTKKKPAQLELFAGAGNPGEGLHGQVHALGLLGWEDALWTKHFEVRLLSGDRLTFDLATLRRSRQDKSSSAAHASSAVKTPNSP